MDADTTGIVISSGAVGAICGVVGTWLKTKVGTKTRIEPDPINAHVTKDPKSVSLGEYNKSQQENERAHENLFQRVGRVEQNVATLMERGVAQEKQLDRMASQVDKLYDRIILGGKSK